MPPTSRELVTQALRFEYPSRLPRQTWTLPIAQNAYPDEIEALHQRWPDDIVQTPSPYRPSPRVRGEPYEIGTYLDEWGCEFHSVQAGLVGEVKTPLIADISDRAKCEPPYETLPEDVSAARDAVNRFRGESEKFVMAACCPRPWERMQFLRGTVNAMMDIMTPEDGGGELLRTIHEFYLAELEFWTATDVDAVMFMDDWGSQQAMLIPPRIWRELFKTLYKDYCDLAHSRGKFIFMHSDGCISEIYEDLVEIGVDAVNSQLATMNLADLARRVKGEITFWGEIDRQHVLPSGDPRIARNAVREVAKYLYDPAGGIIAQFELGPAANPANAFAIYEEWEKIHEEGTNEPGLPAPKG
ncbi:MAG: methyltransferase [Phycisphaerae bacterium]|nr:methyltransferase [Phycisphaerae bacterium]